MKKMPPAPTRNSHTPKNRSPRFRALALGHYWGAILSLYDDPVLLDALASPETLWRRPEARLLLDSRNRVSSLRLPLSNGRQVALVLKEFFPRGVNKLKSLIQPSRAERAWRGALALLAKGVDTPLPVAYLEARGKPKETSRVSGEGHPRGFVRHALFLAEEITPAREIRALFQTFLLGNLGSLLTAMAAHLSSCHDQGLLHRDLSDGNILVEEAPDGRFRFFLIDTTRIRLHHRLGRFRRIKNLIRLGVPAPWQGFFLTEYFRFSGWKDSPLLRAWYRINKRLFTAYVAIKRKLRLRKIARKLGVQ